MLSVYYREQEIIQFTKSRNILNIYCQFQNVFIHVSNIVAVQRNKILLLVTSSVLTLTLLTSVFTINAYAVDIHSKDSYIFFCIVTYKVTFDSVKLNIGESKTVGCDTDKPADINLDPYLPDKKNFARVFYCDHDNPLTWADSDSMKSGDVWTIKCVR
jgi:hypothetical protein